MNDDDSTSDEKKGVAEYIEEMPIEDGLVDHERMRSGRNPLDELIC